MAAALLGRLKKIFAVEIESWGRVTKIFKVKRKDFIRISSLSIAGVLFGRLTSAATVGHIIKPPHAVMLLTDDGWRKCTVSNENYFKYHDVIVTAKLTANDLVVLLNSPKIAIKEVKLIWNHHLGEKALCLGDHWERTYGDVGWSKPDFGKKEPWYLTIYDENSTACFGVKTGCNSICSWSLRPATLELSLNTRSGGTGVWLGDRELNLANIVTTCNSEPESTFQTQRRFCRIMCEQSRLPKQPIYGINDWYYAYGNNSPELILKQSRLMSELVSDTGNLPFCVIDAGWAKYAPALPGDCCWQEDFSKANEKFKDIQALASQLKAIGMRPGLWTRPLCAKSTDPKNLLLPKIRGRENPLNPILDPTIPENIERMKNNFVTYKLWGFEMVKHDFSTFDITGKWGFEKKDQITEEGWRFSDNSKTTAEVINHLYRSIREAAGEMYLIGCNTLSHLSAGKFELNRIGDDTSGKEWSRTRKMGVNCLAFRICQHRSFYFTDGDCVGLTTQVPWEKNKQWMQLLAESSTPLFISAQPDALKLPQKSFIKDCFARAAKVQPIGEPLDWMQDNLPNKWRLNNREVDFDWN